VIQSGHRRRRRISTHVMDVVSVEVVVGRSGDVDATSLIVSVGAGNVVSDVSKIRGARRNGAARATKVEARDDPIAGTPVRSNPDATTTALGPILTSDRRVLPGIHHQSFRLSRCSSIERDREASVPTALVV